MSTRITIRDDYGKSSPDVATSGRKGVEDTFCVWFTDVRVKPAGSDDWMATEWILNAVCVGLDAKTGRYDMRVVEQIVSRHLPDDPDWGCRR